MFLMRSRFLNRKTALEGLFWCAMCALAMGVNAQTVTFQMRNGDRVTGTIVSDATNQVTLKTSWGSTVSLPANEIRTGQLWPTTNGPSAAVLSPVASGPPPGKLPPANSHKWAGEIQAGADILFSEKDHQLYTGRAKITHGYRHLRNLLDYQFSYGETDGEVSENRMSGALKTDFDLTRRAYAYNAGAVGYDAVRKIDFEWEEGPGVGYHLVKRTNFVFRTESGGNYKAQYLDENETTESFYLRFAEDTTWRVTRRMSVDQKFEYFPSVENFANYRMRFESNLRYAILNNLSFIVTVLDNYETQTAMEVPKNDLQIRSSVGVKF